MKRFLFLLSTCWMLTNVLAQTQTIAISTNKTTSLVFPFPVIHVDRGTKDILVQQVKEADNILLVKAGEENFTATNLSVIVKDGSVYSFSVQYKDIPTALIYQLTPIRNTPLATYTSGILNNDATTHGIKAKKWDMVSHVIGIYIKDNTLFYQLQIDNKSTIDYDIDFIRFYIRDKQKGKRTAIQENELSPILVTGNISKVKAGTNNRVVVALEKFTIPDAKYLAIEINEKNGGRHLFMKVNNNKIIRAITLPDYQ